MLHWVCDMDAKLKVYQMNLDGEIDAVKMEEINRIIGQLIKGEMYGLILNFEFGVHVTDPVQQARYRCCRRFENALTPMPWHPKFQSYR